ncbi:hypothetical protein [Cupriavidus sp. EM10]|uniref:hypothetical protein n=1 Tax=Cupriavidus sp. EM10 TaxID=2839983 RepID=UPI001BFFECA0|nr:hypothetical protein [Cupriavidus sp. EM10]QWE95638.1 hypothetical protein KLP38_07305 [Cupriavidus sp. EM10]
MKSRLVDVPVRLTEAEVQEMEEAAQKQGVSAPEYRSYCTRLGAFGWLRANKGLAEDDPTASHSGPEKG